jgi:hypothetical protein
MFIKRRSLIWSAVAKRSGDTAFRRRERAGDSDFFMQQKAAAPGFAFCRRTPKRHSIETGFVFHHSLLTPLALCVFA